MCWAERQPQAADGAWAEGPILDVVWLMPVSHTSQHLSRKWYTGSMSTRTGNHAGSVVQVHSSARLRADPSPRADPRLKRVSSLQDQI